MSKLTFIPYCIEQYAEHVSQPGYKIYNVFKQEKLLDLLRDDYEDLNGMGIEYLINMFDEYLGAKK